MRKSWGSRQEAVVQQSGAVSVQHCSKRERKRAATVQHLRVESVLPEVFQHAEVYGLRAPVEESSDVTQELIRRRQVEKAPDLALLFDSLPHLPISIGGLRLSFVLQSERGIFPIGMDRDHRIVVLGVAKARQFIEAQDFQL